MPSNENKPTSVEYREKKRSIQDELKIRTDLTEKEQKKLSKYTEELDREVVKSKYALMKELEEAAHKKRIEDAKKEGDIVKEYYEKTWGSNEAKFKTLSNLSNSLTSAINKTLDSYLSVQQSMSAHLQGTSTSLQNITETLQSTLSVSGIIKQQDVYTNLSKLVDRGIVYNVEQRAFLETMARDIHATFDATDGTLARLIRIQTQDLSSNRLAIEYSLQTFLNQNYQTSEYIKDSFQNVSKSLFSAQIALQNSTRAIELEAAVQTQLGAMYSGGLSSQTVEGLAKAINSLGSGDVSSLGSGMSNLLVMAAARAGLDYGELLNRGVTGQQATTLLQNVASYLAEMGQNQSNVVKSQLGQLFGVDITDIIAAQKVGNVSGSVGSDINSLFDDYSGFMTFGTRLRNSIENLKYSFGTNIATSPTSMITYEITKLLSESGLGDILFNIGDALKGSKTPIPILGPIMDFLGVGASSLALPLQMAGIGINASPLIPIITSFLNPFGGGGTLWDIFSSIGASANGIAGLYAALGNGDSSKLTVRTTNAGVSGGIYIGNSSTGDLISGSMSSLNELTSNVVTVSSEEDSVTLEDNVSTMSSDLSAILEILDTYMQGISDNLDAIALSSGYSAGGMLGMGLSYAYSHKL